MAATINAMRAAGVPDSKIVDTVLLMEEERLAKGRSRVAKHRKLNTSANESNVTSGTNVTSVTPSPSKERSPRPSKETQPLPITPPNGGEAFELSSDGPGRLDIDQAVDAWNATAKRCSLAEVKKITLQRKRHLAARLNTDGITGWRSILSKIEASPFLRGENDRGWRADFDFIVSESGFAKVLEGKYDRHKTGPPDGNGGLFYDSGSGWTDRENHNPEQPTRTVAPELLPHQMKAMKR